MFDYSILENKSEDDIIKILSSGALDFSEYKKTFFMTGSGGSGLVKPNFTSILSLYLSCIPDVVIVKTGSVGFTSKYGSTDFIKDLNIGFGLKNKDRLLDMGYLYIDVAEIAPWKITPCINISSELENKLTKIFNENCFCDVKCNMRITGIISDQYEKLQGKIIHNDSNQCHYLYTTGKDFSIDECVVGKTYCDGSVMGDISDNIEYCKNIYIKEVNENLLKGLDEDSFWGKSLKKAFYVYTVIMGIFSSQLEALDYLNKIKCDGLLQNKIKLLQTAKNLY